MINWCKSKKYVIIGSCDGMSPTQPEAISLRPEPVLKLLIYCLLGSIRVLSTYLWSFMQIVSIIHVINQKIYFWIMFSVKMIVIITMDQWVKSALIWIMHIPCIIHTSVRECFWSNWAISLPVWALVSNWITAPICSILCNLSINYNLQSSQFSEPREVRRASQYKDAILPIWELPL